MQDYFFHSQLILRTPATSFLPDIDNESLIEVVKDKIFMEAVYLASPSLHHAAIATCDFSARENQNIGFSLAKYLIRSRTRCTPFGLFAGVGVVNWGQETEIKLGDKIKRHTRLDMNYLCALALYLIKLEEVKNQIKFFPNTSIYYLDNEIRYIEYGYNNTQREHQISSVVGDEFIKKILDLASSGLTILQMASHLVSDEIPEQEAVAFLNELIDSQLLVSELDPEITGKEFLSQIITILKRIATSNPFLSNILVSLQNIEFLLTTLDKQEPNGIDIYKKIITTIKDIGVNFEESKLFQTDKNINILKGTLNSKHQSDILNSIKNLNAINKQTENPNISNFISKFYDRYEDEEISLLHALDAEMGVGYLETHLDDYTPLIEDISFETGKNSSEISWNENQKKMLAILQKCNGTNRREVAFSEFNFEASNKKLNLCPSTAIMFRLINGKQVFLESVGGSSAVNLISRFGHANEEVKKIVFDIANLEEDLNKEIIFAEIVHLPESRVGNILLRPDFRTYEIPFLAKSSKDTDHQILLKDLFVSIRYNTLVLRHKPSNKIIIPRLGSAHNFRSNALPVYQFLCDVQTHYFQNGVGFSWGDIAKEFVFLPRVVDGNVVLSAATWQLNNILIKEIIQIKSSIQFAEWRKKHHLPESFLLAEGDNELYIDINNPLLFEIFKNSIKEKNWIVLKEHFINPDIPVSNIKGEVMANQFVAALIRGESVYKNQNIEVLKQDVQRNFSIGSEWFYLKLYCGAKSADVILQFGLKNVLEKAQNENWIDKWFFIRYNDPNPHLRIRFHLTKISYLQEIIGLIDFYIKPFDVIWKIQTDTYKRELERYGYTTIHQAESIFYADSTAYLAFLDATEGDARENIKWLWGLRAIDQLLDAFGYSLPNKKKLIETIRDSFALEFNADQHLKKQLDKKYRENRKEIEQFIEGKEVLFDDILIQKLEVLKNPISEILKSEEQNLDSKVVSFIHMLVNRLISSNPRHHELLMYDFLLRNYTSQIAKLRSC
jgi:thiopeptide-type bacteriocin biosynthesis protein